MIEQKTNPAEIFLKYFADQKSLPHSTPIQSRFRNVAQKLASPANVHCEKPNFLGGIFSHFWWMAFTTNNVEWETTNLLLTRLDNSATF